MGRIIGVLSQAEVPHMVTGSLAAAFHGEPRSTQDVDVVVEVLAEQLNSLCDAFDRLGFYVSRDAARAAVRDVGQFNVIDPDSGWKADLIVRKPRPFSEAEFARRKPALVLGHETFVVSAEDLVVAKLEWAYLGGSDRQLRDVVGILEVQGGAFDLEHVDRWVQQLGLRDLWEQIQGEL